MTDDKFDELADAVLDGSADAQERAELERRVAADPAALEQFRSREAMFRSLREVGAAEPPADLHGSIMAAIHADSPQPAADGWRAALRDLFARRPALAFSYAAAAGFVIGALVTSLATGVLGKGPQGHVPAAGTMAPPETFAGERVDAGAITLGGRRIEAETRREGARIELRLVATAGKPIRIEIAFDAAALRLESCFPPALPARTEIDAGGIAIEGAGPLELKATLEAIANDIEGLGITAISDGMRQAISIAVTPGRAPAIAK